jgi:hypothetical protein
MRKVIASTALLVLATGCGGQGGQPPGEGSGQVAETSAPMPEVDHWLVITDSLGVELGDSNLVFGTIVHAQYLPDGNIAVGDMTKTSLKIYSPFGEYLFSVGRSGSGPGEYMMMSSFAVAPDGSFLVPDAMGAKINFYGPDGEFTGALSGFFPAPPVILSTVENGFVGLKPAFEQNGDEILTGMAVSLWNDSTVPLVTYRQNLIPFDFNNMGDMAKMTILFATDPHGNVYLSQYDTEDYYVVCMAPDGSEIWTLRETYPMVPKSQEDIEAERALVRSRMISGGAPPAMAESYEPDTYRSMIAMLFTDGDGRLWVLSGLHEGAVFRVYDCETAEYLFTSALRAGESHENVVPYITKYGIVGFEADSDDWPRVYLIAPEDQGLFSPQGSPADQEV